MTDVIDIDYSSELFDKADQVIVVPRVEDLRIQDPEVYMQRLSQLQSPKERLIEFFKSQFDPTCDSTHEASVIRRMAVFGLAYGWILGGLTRSKNYHENFQRQHNAAAFEGDHRAKRLYVDNYVYTVIRRGAKFGIGSCIFCTTAGLIGFGSITYRNKLYLPDWLICFGALGGVSRCFLGAKGLIFGTGLGLLGGGLAYGGARLIEVSTGNSVAQWRYLNHIEYLQKRDNELNTLYHLRKQVDQDMISQIR